MDYSIKIGGEAGQGIQTIGETLAKVFSRTGCHVFTHQDYESRIRGGHNFYQVRLSDNPVFAPKDKIDIVVALDRESFQHEKELTENGTVIYDSADLKQKYEGPHLLDIPFVALALEHGKDKIMANTVAVGAVLGMLRMDLNNLFEIIKNTFGKKGEDVVQGNIRSAQAGHDFTMKNCERCSFKVETNIRPPQMLISGVEAIALGAIASGLKFYAAYPMTPSTGIMNYIADKEAEYGIIVEQAEDEIAAINMALGASFAGVRAMTGTAGGGFALMVEGLSLAGMTETPVVIALGQRPAPATGLPTRTEQGDLQFALYTAHGEFPRVVLAPGDPEQAFYLTSKAFDLADKYQIPVIILFDQHLADSQWTSAVFDLGRIKYTDYRLRGEAFGNLPEYKRHAFTETGVTPFGVPGETEHLVVTDSDEHDEEGHIVEDAETRKKMLDKRLFKKLPLIRQEIGAPSFYGDEHPEVVLVGWGSTYGVMKEVVDKGEIKGAAMLHFSEICPFPLTEKFDFITVLNNAKTAICIENNATGQFARLMRTETGYDFKYKINKYDGRPFSVDELLRKILTRLVSLSQ
ncbi:MAG: 2-oxoacid:acceptor oxidoreductase subunit alpha [Nitrospiraceae bacterium]|nr:MAG: 2-oxoacid:acceptor oxidoreductase subunit alpha [Nitrospiraceae bacterium]